ncbi:GDP-mannose 4,6-dehydratase [Candidatus Pelagibacter ubique]|nr:GDP-mannose 4,6-dehydratase [Candidatus Pelagibacter ubique]
MKYLITGGAGFIGSHLVEELIKRNNEVVVIDNFSTGRKTNLDSIKSKKLKIIKSDISKYIKIEKHFKNVDKVFHLAALADIVPSIEDPYSYFDSNVLGTLNVLRASLKYKIKKLVYSASSSCYGIPENYPTNEHSTIKPQYPYALTKWMGEELVLHWSKLYKLNCTSLRLFNVYGTKSRTSGTYGAMFGVFLAQKIYGKPFTIVGDGEQKRDFTYVSDVVQAFLKASKAKEPGKIFNVGSGETVSINKVVSYLKGKKVFIKKRPGEPDVTFADIKMIKNELKWSPKISIKQGIELLISNINYWKKAPVWTPKTIKKETKSWFKYLK